jgi:hypothetical protein
MLPCICSVRRSSHTRSAPALTNNAAGGRRRVLSGISEDMAEPSSIGSAAERWVWLWVSAWLTWFVTLILLAGRCLPFGCVVPDTVSTQV